MKNKKLNVFLRNALIGICGGAGLYLCFAVVSEDVYFSPQFKFYSILTAVFFVLGLALSVFVVCIGKPKTVEALIRLIFMHISNVGVLLLFGTLEIFPKIHNILGIIQDSAADSNGLLALFFMFAVAVSSLLTFCFVSIKEHSIIKGRLND